MDGNWNVYFEDKPVGSCRLQREGLYYRVSCRCNRVPDQICRLMMKCGEETVDLGVLVPADGIFGLDRKLAARNIPAGEPVFFVTVPGRQIQRAFVSVRDGEPFEYVHLLTDARFGQRGGQTGVYFESAHCETVYRE